jgi:hypothetical protein
MTYSPGRVARGRPCVPCGRFAIDLLRRRRVSGPVDQGQENVVDDLDEVGVGHGGLVHDQLVADEVDGHCGDAVADLTRADLAASGGTAQHLVERAGLAGDRPLAQHRRAYPRLLEGRGEQEAQDTGDLANTGGHVAEQCEHDEADELADNIAVIDHGRVVAEGTARSLKSRIGGARVEVSLTRPDAGAADVLAPFAAGPVITDGNGLRLRAGVASAVGLATAVVRAFDQVGITVDDIEVRQPSLDDVFFALAGHASPVGATR